MNNYNHIKKLWTDYFFKNNHEILENNSLKSKDDSLLWINSGISAIKEKFINENNKAYTLIQRCIRTNDLDNIGKTNRHLSSFEMMGNFSIGRYFKKEAIEYAWVFLTGKNYMNLNKENLYITVLESDKVSYDIWTKEIKIKKQNIIKLSKKHNFWKIGFGPCGPCTEIYYRLSDDKGDGKIDFKRDIESDKFLEIWNIVFSEFFYTKEKKYKKLEKCNVDTGCGLERLLAVYEGKNNVFETSLFASIKRIILSKANKDNINNENLYKLIDYIRTLAFMLSENITLNNKKRSYTLKFFLNNILVILIKMSISIDDFKNIFNFYISIYKSMFPDLLKITSAVIINVINYQKKKNDSYLWISKTIRNKKKVNYLFKKDDKNKNYRINKYLYNIYFQIKDFYYPFSRFNSFQAFGTWSFEIEEFTKNTFDFIDFNYVNKMTFSILMPPPNITGILHLGHSLGFFIKDTIIREKKLANYTTLYIPGLDHAGIATKIKVDEYIRNNNIEIKNESEYQNQTEIWREDISKKIINQWDKLNLAINKEYLDFTFTKKNEKIINDCFKELYNDNLIIQKRYLCNWDTSIQSVISNFEIEYRKISQKLYYVKYFINGSEEFLEVATTRPETIIGDVALIANPKNEHFKKYQKNLFINPITKQKINLYFHESVDNDFGSGIVKCTPSCDPFDYKIKKDLNLNEVDIFDNDGKIIGNNKLLLGHHFLPARKIAVDFLKNNNLITKIEDHVSNIPFSKKTKFQIINIIKKQWFVKTTLLKRKCIKLQNSKDKIHFSSINYEKEYLKHLNNYEDWCISRQIKWGYRIPVWYSKNKEKKICFVGEIPENIDPNNYIQDKDVLDTWFSSSLWPIIQSLKTDINRSYPFDLLVTGRDLIFFWVCRMSMICGFYIEKITNKKNALPFRKVFIHGLIKNKDNEKMSKSRNNGVDPMKVIEEHSNDALRLKLLLRKDIKLDFKFDDTNWKEEDSILLKLFNIRIHITSNISNNNKNTEPIINSKNYKIDNYICAFIADEFITFAKELIKEKHKNEKKHVAFNIQIYKKVIKFFRSKFCYDFIHIFAFLNIYIKGMNHNFNYLTTETFVFITSIFGEILLLLNPLIPNITSHIFEEIFKRNIYEYKSIFEINTYFGCINHDFRNFWTNGTIKLSNINIYIDDFYEKKTDESILEIIKNATNYGRNGMTIYYQKEKDLAKEIIDFVLVYLGKKDLYLTKEKIVRKYNLDYSSFTNSFKLLINNHDKNICLYNIFYINFSTEVRNKIKEEFRLLIAKYKKEINILNEKILNNNIVLINHYSDYLFEKNFTFTLKKNKLTKLHSELLNIYNK